MAKPTQTFVPKDEAYYNKAAVKKFGGRYSGKTIRDLNGKIIRGPGYYID